MVKTIVSLHYLSSSKLKRKPASVQPRQIETQAASRAENSSQLCVSAGAEMKRADSNYSAAPRQVSAAALEITVPSPKPQRAELLPQIFCVIKWVRLESKMVFFFSLFWWGWLTPRSLQQEIRWVTATWWNDCVFPVRGPQGDSERHTSIHCLAIYLFFPTSLCLLHSQLEHAQRKREDVFLQTTPWMKLQRLCGVKLWPSPDWKVLSPGFSLSTVTHRALTWEDRDFLSHGAPFTTKPSADKLWLLSLWAASVTSQTVMLHILTFPHRIWGTWTPSVCAGWVTAPLLSKGVFPSICTFDLCYSTLRFYSDIYRKCSDAIWHVNGGS